MSSLFTNREFLVKAMMVVPFTYIAGVILKDMVTVNKVCTVGINDLTNSSLIR